MKKVIGIGLIILGIVSLMRYPSLGVDFYDTLGVFIGAGLLTFLPGYLLIRSVNKNQKLISHSQGLINLPE